MTNLSWLILSSNQLTGEIPPEIWNLTNLHALYLSNNQLTGSIPSEIGNLTNLERVVMHSNQFTGSIPSEIGNLTDLERLKLHTNQLTGSIPETLCNLSNLTWSLEDSMYYFSNIYNNQLCPPYPSCIEEYVGYQDITNCSIADMVNLLPSWNLMSFDIEIEDNAPEVVFAELIESANLIYVTGFDNGLIYFDPNGYPFLNTLASINTGNGYWVKVSEPVTGFSYPEPSGAIAKQMVLNTNPDIVKTNVAMFVNGTVSFQDIDLAEGTRVNIYTESGLLVGEMNIVNDNYLRTGAVYGDDMTTEAVDGALQDEALVFRYNDYESNPVGITFSGNMELSKVDLVFRNIPETFTLHQNFPNPFNPITTLRYDLPEQAFVTLTVFDMLGKEITQLVNTTQLHGFKSVQWDAKDSMGRPVSAGVYLYQIQAGEFVQTRKMVLLK